MKRNILILIVCIVFSLPAFSQSGAIGLRAGAAFPSQYGEGFANDQVENTATFTGGFYINTMLSKFFWLKHDFNYVNRKFITSGGNQNLPTSQHYIDMYPVSPAFHLFGLQIFAGPAVSFLVNFSEDQVQTDNQGNITIVENNDAENRKLLEWGVMGGVEFEAPFGLNAGLRYVRGLTDIYDVDVPGTGKTYNQAFLLTIGWTFRNKDQGDDF